MSLNINDITIGEAKQIAAALHLDGAGALAQTHESPWEIGKNYFIRTVTHHHTGRLVGVTNLELVLEDAAWIADDGRLTEALQQSSFNEVEMFPPGSRVIVGRGSIIDAVQIATIPVSQK